MLSDKQMYFADEILSHIKKEGGVTPNTSFESLFINDLSNIDDVNKIEREVMFVTASLQKDFNLIRIIKGEGIDMMPITLTALTKEGSKALTIGLTKYLEQISNSEKLNQENLELSVANAKKAKFRSNIAFCLSAAAIIISPFLNKFIDRVEYNEDKNGNSKNQSKVSSKEFIIYEGDTVAVISVF